MDKEYANTVPQDWGLPESHGKWRAHQEEALEAILSSPKESIILEMPTGGGKTALAAALAHDKKVLAFVGTRDLQLQYADLYGFDSIWGQGNYECVDEERLEYWESRWGVVPTVDGCPEKPRCEDCPYEAALQVVKQSGRVVTNYHYAWFAAPRLWKNQYVKKVDYLFCDEAHNLALTLIPGLMTLKVSARQKKLYGLPDFPSISGTSGLACTATRDWLLRASAIMVDTLEHIKDQFGDHQEYLTASRFYAKIFSMRWSYEPGHFHLDSTQLKGGHFILRPLSGRRYAYKFKGIGEKQIYMSATIGDPDMLAYELNITDYDFFTFPHNIPAANRPVYVASGAPKLGHKSKEQDYIDQADVIAKLCKQHSGERILIHTTRWDHARKLGSRLKARGLSKRVYVPTQGSDRIAQVQAITSPSREDTIAIGPSFWEGLSLDDDLCRVVMVAKVPFQNRKDPIVAARLKKPGGQKWDKWVAALKVAQGCGRGVRHEKDMAVSYIVDANWKLCSSYAPRWFEVSE